VSHTSRWKKTSQLWQTIHLSDFFLYIVKPLSERIKSLQESSKKRILATALSFQTPYHLKTFSVCATQHLYLLPTHSKNKTAKDLEKLF
jgi:hypothetical protein